MKPTHLAIDFGTSNSLVAAANAEEVFPPIPMDPGAADPTIFRSLIYFPTSQKAFYGSEALRQYIENQGEGRLIRSIKRQLPVRSFVGTFIDDRPFNLEDLVALFLKEIRQRASEFYKTDITKAVLGRPARFSDDDLDDGFAQFRLGEAAKRAGFSEVSFCPEPLAAAYEFRESVSGTKTVLVGDFGGGTSDYTVVRIGQKTFEPSDVLAIGGVPLAGDALDGSVMRRVVSPYFGSDVEYRVPFGTNIMKMPAHLIAKISSPADISFLAVQDAKEFLHQVKQWARSDMDREKMERLLYLVEARLGFYVFERIEEAKRQLSAAPKAVIKFAYPGLALEQPVSKATFEAACEEPIQKILQALDDTVARAGLSPEQIDVVFLTGGTAKVPAVHEGLVRRFGAAKLSEQSLFHSVTKGLAHRAREWARSG